MITYPPLFGCLSLIGWIYLALGHGGFWRLEKERTSPELKAWPSVDIIVPVRNEADILLHSLPSLLAQDYPGAWRIILANDHSDEGTAGVARKIAERLGKTDRLTVIDAPERPQGWAGKVWAMHSGAAQSKSDYILFTDADIRHPPDSLRRLVARAAERKLDLTSRMARLNCEGAAERLLIPTFVFFFALLYPFARSNNPDSRVAAAAGGVMLVKSSALKNVGGMASIKSALIDDCALARVIKRYGGGDIRGEGAIELTLAEDIESLRPYPRIKDVWQMVSRTAFTQLRLSPILLAGTVLSLGILFIAPVLLPLFSSSLLAQGTAFIAWILMAALYLPMVQFYKQRPVWALTLPIAGVIYLAATIDSARLYWQGKGGQWKGRFQA